MSHETNHLSGKGILRPRARILRTIGNELISSESVAIVELVKNAYDADATRVMISFYEPLKTGSGWVEVIDDGNGMSLDTVLHSWMEPATLAKKRNKYSDFFKRRVLGEKGIGRFASSKISNLLEIVTRKRGSEREVRAIFDWEQFDDDARYLDEVEILWDENEPEEIRENGSIKQLWQLEPSKKNPDETHGTILRMSGLQTSWTRSDLETLRTGLSKLISPLMEVEDFKIYLCLPNEFEDLSGLIEVPETLTRPNYRIYGDFKEDGCCELTFTESIQEEKILETLDINSLACGSFYIDLRVWDLDTLEELALSQNTTIRDIRRDIKKAAGISIYRDGFRVLPFGEPENDWLRLDLRRVQNPTLRLSNNQIVGYILISGDANPDLRDQSNREGLVAGIAFTSLRDAVIAILSKVEAKRYASRRRDSIIDPSKPESKGIFSGFNISAISKAVKERKVEDQELIALIVEQEKELKQRVDIVQEILSRYQRLATLGQLIDTVLHDGRAPLFKIGTESKIGLRDIERASDGNNLLQTFGKRFTMIKEQTTVIGNIFRKLEPFGGRKRGRPSKIRLEKIISDAFSVVDSEISKRNVKIELPQTSTDVFVDPSEIQQVIINLLNNSLYWLEKVPQEKRLISVSVNRNNNNEVEIIFSDNGLGVAPEFRERIFDPYFSTRSEGIGLGLTISGEIITEYYAGSLELMEKGTLDGATFRITLNKRV
jgi:signal transduction histidine kinase